MRGHRYGLPLGVVAGVVAVAAATLLLRPRGGLIEPAAVDPTAYFSADQLERAREYRGPQRALAIGGIALSGATLVVLAVRPPPPFRRLCDRVSGRPLLGGAAVGASIALVVTIVVLPIGLIAHERAVDVGLSTQELGPWLADQGRSTAIGLVMAAAGGFAAVALVRRFPRHWWLPGGGLAVAVAVGLVYLSPVVLDPIFNDFEPLGDGELRADVLELAERAGVEVGEVYVVDASRRTTAANAYVGGLGQTKRVVLYDNLIEQLPRDQVRAVVAHELGHQHHGDLPRGILWVAIAALPATLVVQRLTELLDRRAAATRGADRPVRRSVPAEGRHPSARGAPGMLPAVALALAVVSFCVEIAGNQLSRRVEARADAFALELTADPAAFIGLQRSLDVENVSEPDPPELFHAIFGTHPTTLERIGFGLTWADSTPAGE